MTAYIDRDLALCCMQVSAQALACVSVVVTFYLGRNGLMELEILVVVVVVVIMVVV